jgi:hypothetical protein
MPLNTAAADAAALAIEARCKSLTGQQDAQFYKAVVEEIFKAITTNAIVLPTTSGVPTLASPTGPVTGTGSIT